MRNTRRQNKRCSLSQKGGGFNILPAALGMSLLKSGISGFLPKAKPASCIGLHRIETGARVWLAFRMLKFTGFLLISLSLCLKQFTEQSSHKMSFLSFPRPWLVWLSVGSWREDIPAAQGGIFIFRVTQASFSMSFMTSPRRQKTGITTSLPIGGKVYHS